MEKHQLPPSRSVDNTPSDSSKSRWSGVFSFVKFVGLVLAIVLLVNTFGLQSYQVFGQSMQPTLNHGDRLIISKLGKTTAGLLHKEYVPERGDIIVFNDPFFSSRQLIKRVVALPGERVTLEDGNLRVYNEEQPDGFHPDEAYAKDFLFTVGTVDITVPEDHVFVMGDNRGESGSLDSRNELGTVPLDNIVGTLTLRLFPLNEMKLF